ncbi:myelin protein P0-like isoform X2 [Oryzias latipes]|nr:myelin protein P0-like isoform X2 [Oryzias latipes]
MKRTGLLLETTAGSPRMWFLCSVLLLLCGSAESTTPDIQIKKKPGDNVTLMCEDPEYKKDSSLLEWRRNDSKILFLFKDGRPSPYDPHESFRNRVFLNDSQMKDGNLSVVLKNVTMNDTGTYQCNVTHENKDPLKLISTVHLSVVPSGGLSHGGIIGIVLSVLAAAVVLVVGLWNSKKKKGPNQSSRGSNNQQDIELGRLNSDSDAERNNKHISASSG